MDSMVTLFENFSDALQKVLPTSPFRPYIEQFQNLPYVSWLNWFIPVGDIVGVLELWLAAITIFYVYSIVLRWIRAIQ